jgi:hypothetical protein
MNRREELTESPDLVPYQVAAYRRRIGLLVLVACAHSSAQVLLAKGSNRTVVHNAAVVLEGAQKVEFAHIEGPEQERLQDVVRIDRVGEAGVVGVAAREGAEPADAGALVQVQKLNEASGDGQRKKDPPTHHRANRICDLLAVHRCSFVGCVNSPLPARAVLCELVEEALDLGLGDEVAVDAQLA